MYRVLKEFLGGAEKGNQGKLHERPDISGYSGRVGKSQLHRKVSKNVQSKVKGTACKISHVIFKNIHKF